MSFVIQAAGNTDIGLVRKNNEDNFGYDLRHGIFVVCDGMGGQQAGELASKIAVDTVLDYFRQDRNVAPVGGAKFEGVSPRAVGLAGAIQLANQAIHESGASNLHHAGMGSTIVAVAVEGNPVSYTHLDVYKRQAHKSAPTHCVSATKPDVSAACGTDPAVAKPSRGSGQQ